MNLPSRHPRESTRDYADRLGRLAVELRQAAVTERRRADAEDREAERIATEPVLATSDAPDLSPTQARVLDGIRCHQTGASVAALTRWLDRYGTVGDEARVAELLRGLRRLRCVVDGADGWALTARGWRALLREGA